MSEPRCPGQDLRFWKPEDIFLAPCPACGGEIEFWKDEPVCLCPGCGREARNPRRAKGCEQWCRHPGGCTGPPPDP